MYCFLCLYNSMTDRKRCGNCNARIPVVSRMERVRITRDAGTAISTLEHEHAVPFWISEEDLQRRPVSTVIEIEAHGTKVLLVVYGNGEVLASATPADNPLSGVATQRLLRGN
jgi:hypothetical protein